MMETFDFSQVPYGFGVCASVDCAKASTCLRHLALEQAPLQYSFLPTLTPAKLKAMNGKCEYYCSNEKVRFARGFTRALQSLTVRVSGTFRWRLISHFGRKNYYLIRKGELLINPADQQYIIRQARDLGLELDEYFDAYVDTYSWKE